MRLSMRRIQPGAVFASFFGILDIKLGCEIILLFGLINKVAGVYGLTTLIIGGSFVQYLFYAYSVATLFAFLWGLSQIKLETAQKSLLVAHLYTVDHLVQWVFHYIFFYHYWYVEDHGGKRVLNSQAQKDIFELALSRKETSPLGSHGDNELRESALGIWHKEKVYAVGVIFIGFFLKLYWIVVLYSYAAHLRSSSYHSLPLTAHVTAAREAIVAARSAAATPTLPDDGTAEIAHAEAELARMSGPPRRSPQTSPIGSRTARTATGNGTAGKEPRKDSEEEQFSWE